MPICLETPKLDSFSTVLARNHGEPMKMMACLVVERSSVPGDRAHSRPLLALPFVVKVAVGDPELLGSKELKVGPIYGFYPKACIIYILRGSMERRATAGGVRGNCLPASCRSLLMKSSWHVPQRVQVPKFIGCPSSSAWITVLHACERSASEIHFPMLVGPRF